MSFFLARRSPIDWSLWSARATRFESNVCVSRRLVVQTSCSVVGTGHQRTGLPWGVIGGPRALNSPASGEYRAKTVCRPPSNASASATRIRDHSRAWLRRLNTIPFNECSYARQSVVWRHDFSRFPPSGDGSYDLFSGNSTPTPPGQNDSDDWTGFKPGFVELKRKYRS